MATGLESFDAPKNSEVTTFQTNELTALCPFDFGGPDFYTLTIRYESDTLALESRSLKRYLESFRDREATAETIGSEIYERVHEAIEPSRLYVRLEQARRGGIKETVEVGDRDLRE